MADEDTPGDDVERTQPPPAWANASTALCQSVDEPDAKPKPDEAEKPKRKGLQRQGKSLERSAAVEEDEDEAPNEGDDVFDEYSDTALIIHELPPTPTRKPSKRVRIGSTPSIKRDNLAPAWANASFDLDEPPPRPRKPIRQMSLPSPTSDDDDAPLSPGGRRFRRQMTEGSPRSPLQRQVSYRDAPIKRKPSLRLSAKSLDISWANATFDLTDDLPPAYSPGVVSRASLKAAAAIAAGADTLELLEKEKKEAVAPAEEEEEEEDRAGWGGQLEFIFTCIGYAVGLGNVWRFPYLAYKNGGGAFLVPYIFMLAFVGLPLFFLELCMGQFASLGPISIWKFNPALKGLGYAMVIVSWLIAIYYNVIIAHVMLFLFASFASIPSELPWIHCYNWWNSPDCLMPDYDNITATNATNLLNTTVAPVVAAVYNYTRNGTGVVRTPAEEYYTNFVLEQSTGIGDAGDVNWKLALCLLLAWGIVLICLIRGIASLGKVVYFTALFPYVMLTILLIRGVTLPGALIGIKFYLTPDFSRLTDSRVWCDAATQIFYSLGVGSGGLIAMSSYSKFDNNCYRDSLIVALINCATSIYAGLVIFSILGFMALEKNMDVKDVATGGPGLAFIVYPEALSRMPVPVLWAICFFFMMATLGFGSQFSMVETVMSAFTDEFPKYLRGKWHNIIYRCCFIGLMFLLGLPMVTKGGIYLLNLVDYSVSGFPLLIIGFLEIAAASYIYTYHRLSYDICLMLGKKPNWYWKISWYGLTPAVIGLTFLFNCIYYKAPTLDAYIYPPWSESLGHLVALFPIMFIVVWFLYYYFRHGGFKVLQEVSKPLDGWGPAHAADRTDTMYDPNFDALAIEHVDVEYDFDTKPKIVMERPLSTSGAPLQPILRKKDVNANDGVESRPLLNESLLNESLNDTLDGTKVSYSAKRGSGGVSIV